VIEAVLFDWGGTLSQLHQIDLLLAWEAAAEVLAPARAAEMADALLAAEQAGWQETTGSMASFTSERVVELACHSLGVDVTSAEREKALSAYHDRWRPYLPARPDAATTLRALRDSGRRTGLLSNTHWPRRVHEDALARDGLLDLLDGCVFTSELGRMKPHPDAFRSVLEAAGAEASSAVFVGDRLHDDIWGAKQAGMRAVWIRNELMPRYDVEPDAVIDTLSELPAVIERLG
jgi:putative hydrolase of the HAD superfamily